MLVVVAVVEVTSRHPSDVDDVLRGDIWEYVLVVITPLDGLLLRAEGCNHLLLIITPLPQSSQPAQGNILSCGPGSLRERRTGRLLELPCQQFMLN